MKISYNWLKEYIKALPAPDKLADKLTMAGLEVEGIEMLDKGITGVVTAQVISIEKHPNADRLSFCKVKTDKGIHSIVCGAKNMKAGDKVALALPGATLQKGIKIERTKIRGVESEGMMCSEMELGLKHTSEGIMILPHYIPMGRDFTEVMGLNDVILDVNVTPNRPDCLSITGIAREVAAITGATVRGQGPAPAGFKQGSGVRSKSKYSKLRTPNSKLPTVSIKEPSLCRRYAARVIENIKVGTSPDWLKRRLESAGFRPINNIVDVTNYVMIEYGQPLHAFDYALISDKQIIIRRADENEKIRTIDGFERILTQEMLVIADKEKPLALAGIMGGKTSEIHDTTKNILLESAWFNPSCVRRASKALGLSTESSYRFERGVDIEGITRALDRAVQMIQELAGGNIVNGAIDKYPKPYKPAAIQVRPSRINKLLGIDIKKKEVEDCLKRLGIAFKTGGSRQQAVWNIIPPAFRVDLVKEIDIIEEIARIYGYENIPAAMPLARLSTAGGSGMALLRQKAGDILADNGFMEAVNYSFLSPELFTITTDEKDGIKLLNPLTEEQPLIRQSLIPGLLQTLRHNLNHNSRDIKIFEMGNIFQANEERELLSGLVSGHRYGEVWNMKREAVDFYDVKGAVEQILTGFAMDAYFCIPKTDIPFLHPGKTCVVEANNKTLGMLGEIHPDIMRKLDIKQPAYIFELDMEALNTVSSVSKKYTPIPKYPMIMRDAAMILNRDISFQKLYNAVKGLEIKLLEDVNVFDVYYGENIPEGKVSIALRFMYRSEERTLTDDEVNTAHSAVLENLKHRFGVEVRGE